jgi:SAM-dependent methyltransferase
MTSNCLRWVFTGRGGVGPDLGRPWKVWDLDAELRYRPTIEALPDSPLPICEVGSGPAGLAAWTQRPVIGVDPGPDERHGGLLSPPNLQRVEGDGAHIPLGDRSASAAVAVDTLEHVPRDARKAVITEMKRVTADGGRVVLMGPTGSAAAAGDRLVLDRWRERGASQGVVEWLGEHFENGLPTVPELLELIGTERVDSVAVTGVFNLRLWWTMHRATLEDFPQPRGTHLVHHLTWGPFATLARHLKRGPFYRYLVVAQLEAGDGVA